MGCSSWTDWAETATGAASQQAPGGVLGKCDCQTRDLFQTLISASSQVCRTSLSSLPPRLNRTTLPMLSVATMKKGNT